jgi:hypothetical protein
MEIQSDSSVSMHASTCCCCAGSPRSTSILKKNTQRLKALTHCIHRNSSLVATDIRSARLSPSVVVVVDGESTWRRIPTDRTVDRCLYSKTCQLGSDYHRTMAPGPWLPLVVQKPRHKPAASSIARPCRAAWTSDFASVGGSSPLDQVGMGIKPKIWTRITRA